jgi:hypothetical protein
MLVMCGKHACGVDDAPDQEHDADDPLERHQLVDQILGLRLLGDDHARERQDAGQRAAR